jgi:hypothetical protein
MIQLVRNFALDVCVNPCSTAKDPRMNEWEADVNGTLVDDNREAGQGLRLCSAETGTYCCQRDYDCCTNSTLTYTLGQGEPLTTIPKPAPAAKTPTHLPAAIGPHVISDSPRMEYARDTMIGAGAGFGVAALVFAGGGAICMMRRRRRKQRNKERGVVLGSGDDVGKLGGSKEVSVSVSAVGEHSEPIELGPVPRYESSVPRGTATVEEHVVMLEPGASHPQSRSRPEG